MSMLDLTNPALNWVQLAQGMGMPGTRVTTVDAFARALGDALATPGPALIEAMI
jgi:acetolactate synthase-1/2/3 large subunit